MTKKKKALFIGLAAVFIIYLVCSNVIAAQFIPKDMRADKIELGEYGSGDNVLFCLEDNQYAGDRMETAMFSGWAFTKGGTGEDRAIRLVFKGENITYRSQISELSISSEVNSVLESTKPAGLVAFTAYISTISMKNGEYKLYIEHQEDGVSSLLDTGETFKKSWVNWYNTTAYAPIEPLAYADEEQVNAALIPIVAEGKALRIEGSAYLQGIDNAKTKLYAAMQFADGTERWYPLNVKNSLSTVRNEHDINALHSSFSMKVDASDMPRGDVLVRLIVQTEDKNLRSAIVAGYVLE